jgi:hypothetical protein
MTIYSRSEEAGNTLVLKAGDRRSAAAKRIGAIEKSITADLGIERMTEVLRVLCRRAAELTFVGEELSDQLVTGKPISVELMGRNADRLQRTMKELREQAAPVRMREHNARVMRELEGDDDDRDASPLRPTRPRGRQIQSVIVDPKGRAI